MQCIINPKKNVSVFTLKSDMQLKKAKKYPKISHTNRRLIKKKSLRKYRSPYKNIRLNPN